MSYRVLFVINALLSVIFGLVLAFVPAMLLQQFGTETRVPELLLTRLFDAAMATVGLVLWFAKDVLDEGVQMNISLALLINAIPGLIVTAIGIFPARGVIRSSAWIAMLVPAFFL